MAVPPAWSPHQTPLGFRNDARYDQERLDLNEKRASDPNRPLAVIDVDLRGLIIDVDRHGSTINRRTAWIIKEDTAHHMNVIAIGSTPIATAIEQDRTRPPYDHDHQISVPIDSPLQLRSPRQARFTRS